jgi:hypothetical protein
MSFETRRIVTGHAQGRAIVQSDRQLRAQPVPNHSAWFNKIWSTDTWPSDNNDPTDGAERETGLASTNGSVLRIVEMAPGTARPCTAHARSATGWYWPGRSIWNWMKDESSA